MTRAERVRCAVAIDPSSSSYRRCMSGCRWRPGSGGRSLREKGARSPSVDRPRQVIQAGQVPFRAAERWQLQIDEIGVPGPARRRRAHHLFWFITSLVGRPEDVREELLAPQPRPKGEALVDQ